MDDIPMVAAKATNDTQGFRFRIAKRTSESTGREIGGMWFTETQPTLHETCRAIFEEGAQPQKVGDVVELLLEKMSVGAEASHSSHSFAEQPFLSYEMETLMQLGRMFVDGRAHVSHSCIEVSHDDPDLVWDLSDRLGYAGLRDDEREKLRMLKTRRGSVGKPLEMFWRVACHTGLARDAEEERRDYGSGFIPKLKIGNHLFQIERAPLIEQIKHAIYSDCTGLVWVVNNYANGQALQIHLEALTFDDPHKVVEALHAAQVEMNRKIREALDAASKRQPHPMGDLLARFGIPDRDA
jgi:hypothetical protein